MSGCGGEVMGEIIVKVIVPDGDSCKDAAGWWCDRLGGTIYDKRCQLFPNARIRNNIKCASCVEVSCK